MGRADTGLERGMSLRMLGTAKPGQLTPGKIRLELFGERWGWLGRAAGAKRMEGIFFFILRAVSTWEALPLERSVF